MRRCTRHRNRALPTLSYRARHTWRFASRLLALLMLWLPAASLQAQHRKPANVPPVLEIAVLDPGVDPRGNPAVRVRPGPDGQMVVDIPPVILVHRYYYSGDRTFQGPLLPGGPSILVLNHPRTGERLYIPATMMPGAPRVTYTGHGITYDYGRHALCVHFGWNGKPTLKYRNGKTWSQKVGEVLHVEHFKQGYAKVKEGTQDLASRTKTSFGGLAADLSQGTRLVLLPVTNALQLLPFGKVVFSADAERYYAERAANHQRNKQLKHATEARRRAELTLPTNR